MGETSTFGDLLRGYRLAVALSQEALAERAGLSANTVAALERGRRTAPRPDTVTLLADALRLDPDDRATLIAAAAARDPILAAAHSAQTTRTTRTAWSEDASRPPAIALRLPTPPTGLIGRAREVAAVAHLLRAEAGEWTGGRLVTLVGPGGVGKTRLSLAVAEAAREGYADGVAFVDLSALRDPALVASAVAGALGLRETGAQDARELLLAYLRDRELLVVLDNLEQIVEAASLVGELVAACPRLAVLATSRVALRLRAEQRFDVPPLEAPDARPLRSDEVENYPAVRLFVARARATQPDFALDAVSAAAVAEICRRLDGVPLAIELAAARTPLLPPTRLLARLERRLSFLKGGARDLPARQQTLRATIDWSYALLLERERALFRRLSVFAGGGALDAAEAVTALGGADDEHGDVFGDVFAGMATLVDHSLLRSAPNAAASVWRNSLGDPAPPADPASVEPRFRMLETIREFGLEQLAASGEEDATRSAHAAYYLALAHAAKPHLFGPDQMRWLNRLEREGDNLRTALTYARERGDAERGVRLAGALWRFWYIRCHLGEGLDWLREFVALSARVGVGAHSRADALVGLAVITYARTDYDQAAIAAEEAVAATRALDDRPNLTVSLNILGGVARYRGDHERAESLGEECVAVARSITATVPARSPARCLSARWPRRR